MSMLTGAYASAGCDRPYVLARNSCESDAVSTSCFDYKSAFCSQIPDASPGKSIAERVVQWPSSPADASVNPAVKTAGDRVHRIHGNLREMGTAYAALLAAQDACSDPASSLGDEVFYSRLDKERAEQRAVVSLTKISGSSTLDDINEELGKVADEVERLTDKVKGRVVAAYARPSTGTATVNVCLESPDPMAAPVAEGIASVANWIASKVKGSAWATRITKAFVCVALVATWAVPIALTALSASIPPLAAIFGPLAAATMFMVAPLVTRALNLLWINLGPQTPVPTAAVNLTMKTAST